MIIRKKYEILKKIGTGGMASVYLARHLAFDEIRAIKVVRSWMAEDEGFLRRLRSEAVMLRKLQHPNAVRVDDIDNSEDGRPFIVMEYVQGTDLHAIIRDQGPLSVARVLGIARQVASALAAAHKLGIVHRDVKPDNILLVRLEDGSEFVKVLDFGIAKLQGSSTDDPGMTQTGLVLCTPEYASPEQARGLGSDRLDGRSDLYSLGLVMYQMLTGELPFHSDTPLGMLLAQINSPARPPTELKPELKIPSPMSDLLMKALEKDPNQRFQSAEEMLDAMARIDDSATQRARGSNAVPAPASSEGTIPNMRLRVETASAFGKPQKDDSYSVQDLLLDIDKLRRGHQHLWVWSLAVILVLGAAGAIVYVRWQPPSVNTNAVVAHPRDGDILSSVREKLIDVDGGQNIRASVAKGIVSLVGEASSQAIIDEAALSVSAIPGVVEVNKSDVRVVKSPSLGVPVTASAMPPQPPPIASLPAKAGTSNPSPGAAGIRSHEQTDTPAGRPIAPGTSNRIRELMKNAQRAMDDGNYDVAITSYAAVLKIDHGNTEARAGKRKAEHAKQYEEQLDSQE